MRHASALLPQGHNNDKKEGHKAEEFPEVHDCFMIYGGQVVNASARHRKQERREVCSVKVAAPVYLDWSDKPIMYDYKVVVVRLYRVWSYNYRNPILALLTNKSIIP